MRLELGELFGLAISWKAELMALEMRLGQQEIAGRAAQKDEMEGLLLQCSAQLDALRTDVAAVQAGLVQACTDQQEFACHVQDTYLHKKEYNEESTALRKGLELREVHNQEMQAALEVLQLHSKEILRELQSQRSQVEKQEILIKVQEDGSQSFRSDLAALEHRIWEEFAPKTSVAQVFATASEAHTKLDFAMMDRATIRQRMEEELNVLKKTLYRQQSTFKELDDAVSSVNQQDQELLKFCKLLEQEQAKLKELGKRVQQQEERFEEFQSQRQQDRRVTEELHGRVLQHIDAWALPKPNMGRSQLMIPWTKIGYGEKSLRGLEPYGKALAAAQAAEVAARRWQIEFVSEEIAEAEQLSRGASALGCDLGIGENRWRPLVAVRSLSVAPEPLVRSRTLLRCSLPLRKAAPMTEEKDANGGAWSRVPTWDGSPQTWRSFRKDMSWWLAGLDIESTKKYNLAARWLLRQSGMVRQRGEEFDPAELEYQREVRVPDPTTGDDTVVTPEDPLSGIKKLLAALETMTGRTSLDKRGELRQVFYLELRRRSGERISEFAIRFRTLVSELKAEGVVIADGELGWWFKHKLGLDALRSQLLETALAGAEDYPTIEREVLRLFKDLHVADPLRKKANDQDNRAPLLNRFLSQQSTASRPSSYAPSMASSAPRSFRSGTSSSSSGRFTAYRRPQPAKQAMVSEVEEEPEDLVEEAHEADDTGPQSLEEVMTTEAEVLAAELEEAAAQGLDEETLHEVEESVEAAAEAFLTMREARSKLQEVRKDRGYGKPSSPSANAPAASKVSLKKQSDKHPCFDCGLPGHWAGDPECQKPGQQLGRKKGKQPQKQVKVTEALNTEHGEPEAGHEVMVANRLHSNDLSEDFSLAFDMSHRPKEVNVVGGLSRDKRLVGALDSACNRTCTGPEWLSSFLTCLRASAPQAIVDLVKVEDEKETFRSLLSGPHPGEMARPYLRYLPLPYPSTASVERWEAQGRVLCMDKVMAKRHFDKAVKSNGFNYENLREMIHLRNRLGLEVAFCEDPVVHGFKMAKVPDHFGPHGVGLPLHVTELSSVMTEPSLMTDEEMVEANESRQNRELMEDAARGDGISAGPLNQYLIHQQLKKGQAQLIAQAWNRHAADRIRVSHKPRKIRQVLEAEYYKELDGYMHDETFVQTIDLMPVFNEVHANEHNSKNLKAFAKEKPLVTEVYTSAQNVMKEAVRRADGEPVGDEAEVKPEVELSDDEEIDPSEQSMDLGDQVHLDLLEAEDATERKYFIAHCTDFATRFQAAQILPDKSTESVVRFMATKWLPTFGAPRVLVCDQGREVISWEMEEWTSSVSTLLHHIAVQAPWQNGLAERSGGILKTLLAAIVAAKSVVTEAEMEMALAEVARVAMMRLHFSRGMRRAELARSRNSTFEALPEPGSVCYFYRPLRFNTKNSASRKRLSLKRWHGPALLVACEGNASAFLSYKGQLTKCALENVRKASIMEQIAAGTWREAIEEAVEAAKHELPLPQAGDALLEKSGPEGSPLNGDGGEDVVNPATPAFLPSSAAVMNAEENLPLNGDDLPPIQPKELLPMMVPSTPPVPSQEFRWRQMSAAEKTAFTEAAQQAWAVWEENDAIEVLSPEESAMARARVIVPGYKDIFAFGLRKDAPTGSRISQHFLFVFTASNAKKFKDENLCWRLMSADVKSAFLKGDAYMEGSRELFLENVRGDEPKLPFGNQLAKIRKGVFGLADAPRQWMRPNGEDGGHQIMMTVMTVIPQRWRLRNHFFPKGWGIMTRPR
ncbi:unnamed protein product [Durusdinium trenchii]|uniref:Integrase catalytic domain-containing protein n=1 Tax=Durusdinium trenchii TaxID=1381693 RepID=A0ABP0IC71_9DINO